MEMGYKDDLSVFRMTEHELSIWKKDNNLVGMEGEILMSEESWVT